MRDINTIHRKLMIGNQWVDAVAGETFETVDPATETVICSVARGRAADVGLAVEAAEAARHGPWAEITPYERGQMLFRLADLIDQNRDQLAELERLDVGKPVSEALGDMRGVASCFRYNAGAADKMEGATIPLGRFSTPLAVANACLYLASDEASLVSGSCIEVDGARCV